MKKLELQNEDLILLRPVVEVLERLNIKFTLIGATARYFYFHKFYAREEGRATKTTLTLRY